jgi:hypothetical protein
VPADLTLEALSGCVHRQGRKCFRATEQPLTCENFAEIAATHYRYLSIEEQKHFTRFEM